MSLELQAKSRDVKQNSTIRRLREEGMIPAVLNGSNQSRPIYVNSIDFKKTIRETGRNGIIKLVVDNEQHSVMLHDIQTHALKDEILHADFKVVNMKEEIEVQVNVSLTGEAIGVKDGGVLQQAVHQLTVRSLPTKIPKTIDVDVSSLGVGQTITVGEITTSGDYEIIHEQDLVIASILPPKQEEEINSGEQQESDEVEAVEGRETTEE